MFEQGTSKAWQWAEPADKIRWFTDGERRYGTALWKIASVRLKPGESYPDYGQRKVWREGLEVAIKIKSSQGHKRVEWVKVEHPFTALSPVCEVQANHNEARSWRLKKACERLSETTEFVRQTGRRFTTGFRCITTDS